MEGQAYQFADIGLGQNVLVGIRTDDRRVRACAFIVRIPLVGESGRVGQTILIDQTRGIRRQFLTRGQSAGDPHASGVVIEIGRRRRVVPTVPIKTPPRSLNIRPSPGHGSPRRSRSGCRCERSRF